MKKKGQGIAPSALSLPALTVVIPNEAVGVVEESPAVSDEAGAISGGSRALPSAKGEGGTRRVTDEVTAHYTEMLIT